jgi:hypothetical protein
VVRRPVENRIAFAEFFTPEIGRHRAAPDAGSERKSRWLRNRKNWSHGIVKELRKATDAQTNPILAKIQVESNIPFSTSG